MIMFRLKVLEGEPKGLLFIFTLTTILSGNIMTAKIKLNKNETQVLQSLLGLFSLPRTGLHRRLKAGHLLAFKSLEGKNLISMDKDGNIKLKDKQQINSLLSL